MSSRNSDDISALLYLVPFVAPGAYAIYLWASAGISATLPSSVYLTVTRDPILFAVGTFALFLGLILDVRGASPADRRSKVASLSSMLQSMAVFSLVVLVISALYANGGDVSGAADDILVGRFGLVFPALLVLLSYLETAEFGLTSLKTPKVMGVIAMLLVPAVLYEIGRRQIFVGLALGLVLFVAGSFLFLRKEPSKPKTEAQ